MFDKKKRGVNMKLGEFVKQQRLNKGLTQEQLANLCELSFVTINSIENNKKPGIRTINMLSKIFDTSVADLRNMLNEDNE